LDTTQVRKRASSSLALMKKECLRVAALTLRKMQEVEIAV